VLVGSLLEAVTGLDIPLVEPKQKAPPQKSVASRKRKAPTPTSDTEDSADAEDGEQKSKVARVTDDAAGQEDQAGPRRSARNAGKKVDYDTAKDKSIEPLYVKKRREVDPELGPAGREDGRRLHDPYVATVNLDLVLV
jgi:E3 ubiquitin-protein ligase UHRF1